ncbi:MAG: HEPN domain-containing protein [Spirochaetaceae bacterium]|nr:HEPN domain-containing protein [Spirochaetaceae bacterium]
MKKLVEDWIFMAGRDLKTAEILIKEDSPLTNIIAFHCQQAIEKYLKAYLIEKNIPLIKTHDLIRLNNMIKEIKNLGIDEKKLIIINEVYIETRYPSELGLLPDGLPATEQVEEFIKYTKEIKDIITNELK